MERRHVSCDRVLAVLLGSLAIGCEQAREARDRQDHPASVAATGGEAGGDEEGGGDTDGPGPGSSSTTGVGGASGGRLPCGGAYAASPDQIYATAAGQDLRLDLYEPMVGDACPVVVWIHGGGWLSGDKTLQGGHAALRQASRGYVVASIEYRLSSEAPFPAQIHDVKSAIRWLRANAGEHRIDPDRIAVFGSSAGGHLAALAGTSGDVDELEDLSMGNALESSRVQAVVDWYGPTELLEMDAQALPCAPFCHVCPGSPESKLVGCSLPQCPDAAKAASPNAYVSSDDPPFFIQHGSADCVVAPGQSEILHDSLLAAGVPTTLAPLEGAAHGGPEFDTEENLLLVDAFLDDALH